MIRSPLLLVLLLTSISLQAHNLQSIDGANSATHDAADAAPRASFTASFPEISVVDQHNRTLALDSLFEQDRNVVFAFFFSHCISVCTAITQNLQSLQADFPAGTLIAMISIDPDNDTPDLLAAYAKQHRIDNPNWYLLTGDKQEIVDLQQAFEAYRGNKMNHTTSLFVKRSDSKVITEFKRNFSDIPGFLKSSQAG